jgi:hypothetical protein
MRLFRACHPIWVVPQEPRFILGWGAPLRAIRKERSEKKGVRVFQENKISLLSYIKHKNINVFDLFYAHFYLGNLFFRLSLIRQKPLRAEPESKYAIISLVELVN